MKHCEGNLHAWQDEGEGRRFCPACGLHTCAPGACVLALDPIPASIHPVTYHAICRACGLKTTWPPAEHHALMPPDDHHTTADYAGQAVRFGHAPPSREPPAIEVPPCVGCARAATRYHPDSNRPVCDTCEDS